MSEREPIFETKSVEESEKETQGISIAAEIASLRSKAKSDEDYKLILEKTFELQKLFGLTSPEGKLSGEVAKQIEKAKEILGSDCLGPEEVEKAFGIDIELAKIPEIPFSQKELEKAKELGQFLIFRADNIPEDKLVLPNVKQTLDKAPETRWALVSKEIIPNSTNKNYLEQTEQIIQYLQQVFAGSEMPTEYQKAIREFEAQKEELHSLSVSSDAKKWKPAAERLANLKINQLTRQSLDETRYDLEVYYQTNKEYLLPNRWTWTNSRSSDGGLVRVGDFVSGGVDVDSDGPDDSSDGLGVSFSRSF